MISHNWDHNETSFFSISYEENLIANSPSILNDISSQNIINAVIIITVLDLHLTNSVSLTWLDRVLDGSVRPSSYLNHNNYLLYLSIFHASE